MEPFDVISYSSTYVKRFRVYGVKTVFKFNPPPQGVTEIDWIKKGLDQLVNTMKENTTDDDQLGFTITSLNFKNKDPGYVSFRPANEVSGNTLWDVFGSIVQSNSESMTTSDTFKITGTMVSLPKGSGRNRCGFYNNFQEECRRRRGILSIENGDNLCLPRALVVAKAYAKKDPEKNLILKDRKKRQTLKAKKLVGKARVEIPEDGCGIPELEKFQEHLKKYNIVVYNYNTKGREVYYKGNNEKAVSNLNLLFQDGHYNVVTSLTAAFACHYYCEACNSPYDHKGEHRCLKICSSCNTISPPCTLQYDGVKCPKCNRHFKNQTCFAAHRGDVCNRVKICKDCNKIVLRGTKSSEHKCGEVFCKTCLGYKPQNHKCFMRVDNRTPPERDFLFIFFDFETTQDSKLQNDDSTAVHQVNLCVSQEFCWECIGGQLCQRCLPRTRIFQEEPINHFMDHVMNLRKRFKNICLIAHNGQSFDFQFILKYILEQTKFTPKLIMRGTKVILMQIDNLRFIDSLSYFPMSLANLPKAFDLPPEMKKGYFPHLFNTEDNQSYCGPMPGKQYYCPGSMFEENYTDFNKWYEEQLNGNYVFVLKKELIEYCMSDVDILARACLKFRTLFLEQCNVDPFLEAITIASACNLAFRRNFLQPDTISLIPQNGYRLSDRHSGISLKWLTWEEEKRGVRISHAGREREVKVDGMKVDGFDGKRIYEFHGCYFHGCPKCYPFKREEVLKESPSDTLQLRFEKTQAKILKLINTPYEVVEMWECEFNKIRKQNNLKHLDTLPILNTMPLDPREAFYGGRTGNTKSFHQCKEDEIIEYMDVCSLYPWVCKYGKFPVGHPTIHVGNEECQKIGMNAEGLLKCTILPPSELYHPVLPLKMNGKLMFVLCRTCGEGLNNGECEHSTYERALTGTWIMDEIRTAVEKGYKIVEMFEMWEYNVSKFETGGLFTEFVNRFLKIKQESSGYPSLCDTEEEKSIYIQKYFENEGILLEKNKILKNEGLRSLAKLILNSFWGKFGQRENLPKTLITRQPEEFFKIMTNPNIQVNTLQEINEEIILVNYQNNEEVVEHSNTANVVVALYTTAQARLKLYSYLENLGQQVLYYDTDSVLYVYKEGCARVQTGDYLGEMTNELEKEYGPQSHITTFVSGGPKTYAYLVKRGDNQEIKSVCKVKGLTLNLATSTTINFETLKHMVLDNSTTKEVEESRIRRTKDKNVVTVKENKIFRITGAKRKLNSDYDTVPYGYKRIKE